jgi:hypothetical protein
VTALMSAAVRAGADILIQEPSMKKEEGGWDAKILDANFIYIHGVGDNKPYVLTAIRKYMNWNDYGGVRGPERVGIEIRKTRVINVYHHKEKTLDITGIKREISDSNLKRWVCAGDFNCHHSLWDGDGRESAWSWREVKELIEYGRLMIEPGTSTWRGGKITELAQLTW